MSITRRAVAGVLALLLLSASPSVHAQAPDVGPHTFNTMAYGRIAEDILGFPSAVALDSAGNLVVGQSDVLNGTFGNLVRISALGVVSEPTGAMNGPRGLGVDSSGNTYVATMLGGVQKVTQGNVISAYNAQSMSIVFNPTDVTVASGVTIYMASQTAIYSLPETGDPVLVAGGFTQIAGLAVGADNAIYISDRATHTISKLASGVVTTLAGTSGTPGSVDGTGTAANFFQPSGLTAAADGTVFVADRGNRLIRRVTAAGVVTTFAGVPSRTYTGANANLQAPQGLALSPNGLLYVADTANHRITRLTLDASRERPSSYATVAGAFRIAGSTDDVGARFVTLADVAVDASGTTFVTDDSQDAIYAIAPTGDVSIYAGSPRTSGWRDGPRASALFNQPQGLACDTAGNLYVSERENKTIRKITPAGVVSTLAGMGGLEVGTAVDGAGAAASFKSPQAVAVGPDGTIYVADGDSTIRAVTAAGVVTTLAGSAGTTGSADGTGAAARFNNPVDLDVDAAGNLYVVDSNNSTIRKVTPAGVVTTFAGVAGSRDHVDGTGTAARFWNPSGLGIDGVGNVLVSDNRGNIIRHVTPAGVVTTIAGAPGVDAVVDGTGTAAGFDELRGIAVRADGTRLVVDRAFLRTVSTSAVVTTIAGGGDFEGGSARFNSPAAIASDTAGVLFIADTGNHTIRRLTSAGVVTTLAGTAGASGSADGTGAEARFSSPNGLIVSGTTVYVADTGNHTIRAITAAGVVTTIAGLAGTSGGADGTGDAARFNGPRGIAVVSGDLFVADTGNHVIRKITSTGVVTTVAGLAGTSGSTDGTGAAARFLSPAGVTADAAGNLMVSDTGNHALRAITPAGVVTTIGGAAAEPGLVNGLATEARLESPVGIAVSADGTLYVADTGNWAIRQGIVGTASVPVITTHPANQTINQGQTATFTVGVSANPGASYQWQYEESVGSGVFVAVTGAIYSSFSTSTLRSGRVRVVVGNAAGYTASDWATLTVHALTLSPDRINVGGTRVAVGQPLVDVTPAQTVTVTFAGTGTPSWTATSRVPWLQITGGAGTGSGSFTVVLSDPSNTLAHYSTQPFGVFPGSIHQLIDVTATNLGLTTTLSLVLQLIDNSSVGPVGNLDTPANNATGLAGTLAVTGWALDDVAVQRVEVWRNCVEAIDRARNVCFAPRSSDAANFVFIGNGTFVPGARTDLQTGIYQSYPQAYRGGWGYLLLSNALPHIPNGTPQGGQGTFALTAFAVDGSNNYTQIGAKTITLANDTATLPFGAIDTPDQGATIPGPTAPYNEPHAYPVFGWAMTQSGKCIDTTSTAVYKVFVDGVQQTLAPATNWFAGLNRSDVAAAYPGLCNTNNAVAAYYLDTRPLANGLHTIGWEVTDDNNQTAGIGSRFFTVLNTGSDAPIVLAPSDTITSHTRLTARALRAAIGQADTSVALRAGDDGVYRVRLPQMGRLAVDLDGAVTGGYQQVGEELFALPGGSALDAKAGRFFWQPPIGFLGVFHLVFVTGAERVDVEVTIVDATADGGEAAVTITSPRAGANPNPIITVAGSARDPRAVSGSGTETVHVWARPMDSAAPPAFLGAAAMRGAEYQLTSKPLAAGTYQIEVYAWVARLGTWAPAATVTIAVR